MFNLDNVSYIEDSNGKKAVILSLESYNKIQSQLEELEDIKSYITEKNNPGETIPIELVEELVMRNDSKISIMRKYRGYSVKELSKLADITDSYLSQIESGKRKGTIDIYKKLGKILDIDLELIT